MKRAKKLFSATAMPDRDWWQVLWPDPIGVLQALGIRTTLTVVDLCCGDGYFTAPLARLVEGKVYGIDLDSDMLAKARREATRYGVPVRQWICGDARDLPALLPERVDFVLLANTFHGVAEKTVLAQGVAIALKTGGRFAIVNWHARPREQTVVLGQPRGPATELRMSPAQVQAVVEPAGFEQEQVIELPPYHYGIVFQKHSAESSINNNKGQIGI